MFKLTEFQTNHIQFILNLPIKMVIFEWVLKNIMLLTSQTNVAANLDSTEEDSVVLYLVAKGAKVNEVDSYGSTPLHFASMRGNELVAWELLRCGGVDIEVRSGLTGTWLTA